MAPNYITEIYKQISACNKKFGKYRKCIFHLHTPASYDYKMFHESNKAYGEISENVIIDYCKNVKLLGDLDIIENVTVDSDFYDLKEMMAYSLIAWMLLKNEIELVVITDHNCIKGYQKLKKAIYLVKKFKSCKVYTEVVLGIEISCADKNHVVGIYDEKKCKKDKIEQWIKDNVLSPESGTYKTAIQVIEWIESLKGIGYIAHIDTSDIFKADYLNGAYKKVLFENPALNVIGVNKSESIMEIAERISHYSKKEFTYVVDEDSHDIETISTKSFWIKGSKCCFNMIYDAIRDSNISIEYKLPSESQKYIKGIALRSENGFLKAAGSNLLCVGLSDSLNCIIGGRGTGKSTLLNIINFVLGQNVISNSVLEQICAHDEVWILCYYGSRNFLVRFNAPGKEEDNESIVKYLIDPQYRTRGSDYDFSVYRNHVKEFVIKKCIEIYEVKGERHLRVRLLSFGEKLKYLDAFFYTAYSVNELVNIASSKNISQFLYDIVLREKKIPSYSSIHRANNIEELIIMINKIRITEKNRIKKITEIICDFNNTQDSLRVVYKPMVGKVSIEDLRFILFPLEKEGKLYNTYYERYNIKKISVLSYMYTLMEKVDALSIITYFLNEDYKAINSIQSILEFTEEPTRRMVEDGIHRITKNDFVVVLELIRNQLINMDTLMSLSDLLIQHMAQNDYLDLEFDINSNARSTSLGKLYRSVNSISLGQKVVAMLTFILGYDEYQNKCTPLLIDQPEDNLDSQYIYNNLVKELRNLKSKRQIIIATHNATLVTNAKAEQVIVMESDNVHGRILTTGYPNENNIKKYIVNLLEGGIPSFEHKCFIYHDIINVE